LIKAKVILVLLSFVFLAACGPSDEAIEATIEGRVQVSVAETVAAIPTQTPFPTLTPYPTPTVNPVPSAFRTQLNTFLQAGNAVTGATSQGVTYVELRRLVNEARGAYDFAVAIWPESIPAASQAEFEKAFEGWDLTLYLWDLRIGDYDEPVEPNINRYEDFLAYSDVLIRDVHPDDFIVPDYRGMEYISFDNVELLMSISRDHFEAGQAVVLSYLD
jgi:hypothetical protein